jgi:hypothetical protein
MSKVWDEAEIQRYIDELVEESLTLDYKAAGALDAGKKDEITKDISAMANSAGGMLIYGLKEYSDKSKKHLPETIDPINRTRFSKERLEDFIGNIQPRLSGVIIHPVGISTGPNDVVYVVEIPQGTTAHQATDKKYYKRFNFKSEPMHDYEIRDILNRAATPDASVKFTFLKQHITADVHRYRLEISVKNRGTNLIKYFQLVFTFPGLISFDPNFLRNRDNIVMGQNPDGDHLVTYRSQIALFPNEERAIGHEFNWFYEINKEKYQLMREGERNGQQTVVAWTLYADNMTPKQGDVPFSDLHCY